MATPTKREAFSIAISPDTATTREKRKRHRERRSLIKEREGGSFSRSIGRLSRTLSYARATPSTIDAWPAVAERPKRSSFPRRTFSFNRPKSDEGADGIRARRFSFGHVAGHAAGRLEASPDADACVPVRQPPLARKRFSFPSRLSYSRSQQLEASAAPEGSAQAATTSRDANEDFMMPSPPPPPARKRRPSAVTE